MKRQFRLYLFTLGIAICATSSLLGDGPTFTTIDFPGATSGWPWNINTHGDIVGYYVSADKVTHGYLLSGGQYSTIDFPGAISTIAFGINPGGDIVGSYTVDPAPNASLAPTGSVVHGFLLKGGQFTTIDFPGAVSTGMATSGINPRGDIVGVYVSADKVTHGFLLTGGKFSIIDYPGFVGLSGINPQGDIVGTYNNSGFLLSDGDFTSIDFPGSTFTNTTGLNARGDVVGRYTANSVIHGYLLSGGQYSTIDLPGATFTGATGINKGGDIILGRYFNADTVFHGFVLTGFRPANGCAAGN